MQQRCRGPMEALGGSVGLWAGTRRGSAWALAACGLWCGAAALGCTTQPVQDAGTNLGVATPDAGVRDASLQDASLQEASPDGVVPTPTLDAGMPASDSGAQDAATDAGAAIEGYDGPLDLVSAGLYRPGTQELAEGVRAYAPRFALWSDDAQKARYLSLPPGAVIDTSDMDQWVFPTGTRAFKEFFAVDPNGGDPIRVETRLLEKRADGTWLSISFVWNPEQTHATPTPWGMEDVLGTNHDVPSQEDCESCHLGNRDFLLGIDAIQLSHPAGAAPPNTAPELTLAGLRAAGRLSHDPGTDAFALPGSGEAQAALGMLHANCGSCHQPDTFAFERTDLDLRLYVDELATVEGTATFRTSVGVENQKRFDEWPLRIATGDSVSSAMVGRMLSREGQVAMPPLATEVPDSDGAAVLSAWIDSL